MRWSWLFLIALVGVAAMLGLELLRRRRERVAGPHLVDELRDWHRRPPAMPDIHLPALKPLKSRRASDERVTAFPQRKVR